MDGRLLVVLESYSMMHRNSQVLNLLFDIELVPGPVVEDGQDAVDLPRLDFLALV